MLPNARMVRPSALDLSEGPETEAQQRSAMVAQVNAWIRDAAAAAGMEVTIPEGGAAGFKALGAAMLRNGASMTAPRGRCSVCECPVELDMGDAGSAASLRWRLLCELCRFRSMDPFRVVPEGNGLLHFSRVDPGESTVPLTLPDLRTWRKEGFEVELRMLRRSSVGNTDHNPLHQEWPRRLQIIVNGRKILQVKPKLRLHRRRDVPLALSVVLKAGVNQVRLIAEDDCVADFVLAIVRVYSRLPRHLVRYVQRPSHQECQERVRQLLTERKSEAKEGEGVEAIGDERLPLVCPLTLLRPASAPTRGPNCTHMQCFDLEFFLITQFRTKAFNNRWRCPLCGLDSRPSDLHIDAFVQSILEATDEAIGEVVVTAEGFWRAPMVKSSDKELALDRKPANLCVVDDLGEADAGRRRKVKRKRSDGTGCKSKRSAIAGHDARKSKHGKCHSGFAAKNSTDLKSALQTSADDLHMHQKHYSKGSQEVDRSYLLPYVLPTPKQPKRFITKTARVRKMPKVPPPDRTIDLDSDAPPEEVDSDSGADGRGVVVAPEYF
jgi:hypothetical protein